MGSINAQIGKIAGLQIAERGGRRLKAALSCAAWFAQERPLRGGRVFRRYRKRVRIAEYECGWYRGRLAFRPKESGAEGFFVATKIGDRS